MVFLHRVAIDLDNSRAGRQLGLAGQIQQVGVDKQQHVGLAKRVAAEDVRAGSRW